ncbi:MAG: precorrin-2 C(20)-methyltransferase [Candidatus Caldatribacterium sp.]|nr:precorrin-2 C(20)-methyltransferase [Candidatus Caldatribacterium sp.]
MKLWIVGVGPGDPRLLTVHAVEVLRRVELAFAPLMGSELESRAYQVACPYLSPGCAVVYLSLEDPHASRRVVEALASRKPKEAAFLVLGDPGLYGSPFRILPEVAGGIPLEVEVIPGISAHQVMSARLLLPLAQGGEILSIVPGTAEKERIGTLLANSDTCVVYKVASLFRRVALDFGDSFEGWIGENLATEKEKIYPLANCSLSLPYFSLAFLRRRKSPYLLQSL